MVLRRSAGAGPILGTNPALDSRGGGLYSDFICSYPAANDLVAGFERLGLLREITGGARNRVFQYDPYAAIFGELKP